MSAIGTGLRVAGEVIPMGEALWDIYQAWNSNELTVYQKTQIISVNVLFVGIQGASLRANFKKLDPKTRLQLSAGAAGAAIFREGFKLSRKPEVKVGDYIEFAGSVIFRLCNVTNDLCLLQPSLLGKHLKSVETLTDYAGGVGVLMSSKTIHSVCGKVHQTLRTINAICTSVLTPLHPPKVNVILNADNQFGFEANKEIVDQLTLLQQKQNISEFDTIPNYFARDATLSQYVCPMTQKRIRFAFTHKANHLLHYEKEAIKEWFQNHLPGETPPGWPAGLEVNLDSLLQLPAVQQVIDQTLKILLDGIKSLDLQIMQGDEYEGFILTRAKELGIDDPDVESGDIAEDILKNLTPGLVSAVSVMRGSHCFKEGEDPKKIRKITMFPTSRFKQPLPMIESDPIARALLGSKSNHDKNALKAACASGSMVEILISTDLDEYTIR